MNRSRSFALVVLVSALVASCREPLPDVGGPFGDKVAEYMPKIEKATGLAFKAPPKLEMRTREQVRAFLTARLEEPDVRRDLAGQTAAYHVLGLIPDTLDLQKYFVPLLTEQIIGYYDPRAKVLYVVQGAPDDYTGLTIMHEMVHALQDQYVNLDSLQRLTGNDDSQAAVQAVIEGQATYEQAAIMAGPSNIAAALPSGWEQMRTNIRAAQKAQPIFSAAPMVIQESLLFPYLNGADFVRRSKLKGKPSAFDDLPRSTEQVMHDAAYFTDKRDEPITVTLPPVAGSFYENTMGEFGTRLILYKHLGEVGDAANASAGWGGDRFVVAHVPGGDGLAWVSVWDTEQDAAEFVSGLGAAMAARLETPGTKSATERRFDGWKRSVVITTRPVGGRTAVLYVDVPRGGNTSLLDLSRVTIK